MTRSRLTKLIPCRRPRRPRTRRAVKIPGRATSMRTSKRMPGTGRRSVSSVIHRRICGRATAPPPTTRRAVRRRRPSSGALLARLSVPSPDDRLRRPREREPPDAAGHQTHQEQQREQQAKRQPQQASQSQHNKWPLQQQSKRGTRYPPTLLQKRSHPPRLQVLPGKRSQTSSRRTWQAPAKTDGRAAMDTPLETGGTPAAAPGHRRLRDHRLHTLLGPTSGQPSCFHGPQAGRRSR